MAKENIDGMAFKGRNLRVRYAVHGASLKISELNPFVSNELLYQVCKIVQNYYACMYIYFVDSTIDVAQGGLGSSVFFVAPELLVDQSSRRSLIKF